MARRITIAPALGSALALALAQAGAARPLAPVPELLPLSEADMTRTMETGCTFTFDKGRATLLQTIGRDVTIRTAQGVSLCRIDQAQVDAFTDGKRPLTCGGRTLRLRRTGAVESFPESDSSSWPAALTVSRGKTSRTLRGSAGVAC